MVVEVAVAEATLGVVGTTGGLRHRLARRRAQARPEPVETLRGNPAWRLLGSDQEIQEAIERAIACEQASIVVSHLRAQRLAELRTHLTAGAPATLAPAQAEVPGRARPGPMPRAS